MSTAPTATTYTHDDVVGLAMTIRGRVVLPVNTREFRAELERSHNCGFWSRHPLMFVLCHDAPDVQRALEFCKRFQLPLSVRSGGHSACGSSVKDGTVVIDLSRMRRIQYDTATEEVTMESGCLLGDVNVYLLRYGRMTPVGVAPPTGVGGLCLHGGIGFLTHCYGLSVDHITRLSMVLADGTLKTVNATSVENDDANLYFAARGNAGSLGIVVSFSMRTFPTKTITGGFWAMLDDDNYTETRCLVKKARDIVLEQEAAGKRTFTGSLFLGNVPPDPNVPEQHHGAPCTLAFIGAFGDDEEEATKLLQPFCNREIVLGRAPAPMPFNMFNQTMADMFLNFPPLANYWKGSMMHELPDALVEQFCDLWVGHDPEFGGSMVGFEFMGGKAGRDFGAQLNRDADHSLSSLRNFTFSAAAMLYFPNDTGLLERAKPLARQLVDLFDQSVSASYANYHTELERELNDASQSRQRLLRVKGKVDPTNMFSRMVVKTEI